VVNRERLESNRFTNPDVLEPRITNESQKRVGWMSNNFTRGSLAFAFVAVALIAIGNPFSAPALSAAPAAVPAPVVDNPLATSPKEETAVFAGGCFWGIQAVYQHVKGVKSAVSGYAG
jgi:peptide-methionine (S)-S-oxide reductase